MQPDDSLDLPLSSDLLPRFHTMDTATAVTLLALVMAMAGVSQALHIQGSLDKNDILLGSEENMSDHLLGLVRRKYSRIKVAKIFASMIYM